MGHGTIEETFSRYGHLMPGARDHAREVVDAYMDSMTHKLKQEKDASTA